MTHAELARRARPLIARFASAITKLIHRQVSEQIAHARAAALAAFNDQEKQTDVRTTDAEPEVAHGATDLDAYEDEANELLDLTLELKDRGVKHASKARVVRVALLHLRKSKTVTEIGNLIDQLPASGR